MTASKAQWNQQLLLTPEWNPFCLSVWPLLIYLMGLGTSPCLILGWPTLSVLWPAQFGTIYLQPKPLLCFMFLLLINCLPPIKSVFMGWKAVKGKQLLQSTFSSLFISFAKLRSLASCILGQNSKYSIVHYTVENTFVLECGIHFFLGRESQNGLG